MYSLMDFLGFPLEKSYEQNFLFFFFFILIHTTRVKVWCPHCLYSKKISQGKLTVMGVCICHLSSPLQGGSTDNKSLLYIAMESPLRGHQAQELF